VLISTIALGLIFQTDLRLFVRRADYLGHPQCLGGVSPCWRDNPLRIVASSWCLRSVPRRRLGFVLPTRTRLGLASAPARQRPRSGHLLGMDLAHVAMGQPWRSRCARRGGRLFRRARVRRAPFNVARPLVTLLAVVGPGRLGSLKGA